MRVLVTGARGFVGRHLVRALEQRGDRALETDRDDLDVCDPGAVAACVARERPDAIVHLAALSSVGAAQRDARLAYRVNYAGTRHLLDAAARFAPQARVLLVGSGEVYGPLPAEARAFDERAALRPTSVYGRSKAAADLLGAAFAARELAVVRARAFSHSGPGQSPEFVLASFAAQLCEIEKGSRDPALRVGNLESIRDFLGVADVVDAYLALLDPAVAPGAYNIASGEGHRIGSLLERLMQIVGVRAELRVEPARLRPADRSVGSADRLRRATGWTPRIAIDRMLEGLAEDWRRRVSAA